MSTTAPVKENAIIKTSYGEMTLAFWPDEQRSNAFLT